MKSELEEQQEFVRWLNSINALPHIQEKAQQHLDELRSNNCAEEPGRIRDQAKGVAKERLAVASTEENGIRAG